MISLALTLTLACAPGPTPGAEEDFRALHARVYDAYTLGAEGAAPDRDALHRHLAASFSGEALTREYIEHFTTLARMHEAGVRVEVRSVRYGDVLALPGGRVEAEWTVTGEAFHPTHTHTRVNRYHAIYTLAETAGGPRIVHTRMKNLRRLAEPPPG